MSNNECVILNILTLLAWSI